MYTRTLFHILWTVDKKSPLITIVMLGGARTIFNIVFVWKKKVIYTLDALRVSKTTVCRDRCAIENYKKLFYLYYISLLF